MIISRLIIAGPATLALGVLRLRHIAAKQAER